MSTRANSLQAALASAATEKKNEKAQVAAKKKATAEGRAGKPQMAKPEAAETPVKATKPSRSATVLVGGHFPSSVSRQLRMIAAEEGTTNQALLAEALDLLFTKKGKEKIEGLTARVEKEKAAL